MSQQRPKVLLLVIPHRITFSFLWLFVRFALLRLAKKRLSRRKFICFHSQARLAILSMNFFCLGPEGMRCRIISPFGTKEKNESLNAHSKDEQKGKPKFCLRFKASSMHVNRPVSRRKVVKSRLFIDSEAESSFVIIFRSRTLMERTGAAPSVCEALVCAAKKASPTQLQGARANPFNINVRDVEFMMWEKTSRGCCLLLFCLSVAMSENIIRHRVNINLIDFA